MKKCVWELRSSQLSGKEIEVYIFLKSGSKVKIIGKLGKGLVQVERLDNQKIMIVPIVALVKLDNIQGG